MTMTSRVFWPNSSSLALQSTTAMTSTESIEQASRLAKQAYLQVTQIDPLSPNASPRTKEKFKTMLTDVTQACSQALEWTMGMSVVGGLEGNIGPDAWSKFYYCVQVYSLTLEN